MTIDGFKKSCVAGTGIHSIVEAFRSRSPALTIGFVLALTLGLAPWAAEPIHAAPMPAPPADPAGHQGDSGASSSSGSRISAPRAFADLSAWLDYKSKSQRPALPQEARLFYRRGLIAWEAGMRDEAIRLVRGSAELDPRFAAPHFTLVSWFLAREPGQALLHLAAVLEIARQDFIFQLTWVANALAVLLQAWFLGFLAAGVIMVALRHDELRHGWEERLARWLSPRSAMIWSWAFLIIPYLLGFGVVAPTVMFLALLWPSSKLAERAFLVIWVATLVATPLAMRQMERLASPLRNDQAPFYGVLNLEETIDGKVSTEHLGRLAAQHPDNPFLHFGLGWLARHDQNLTVAEAEYRQALALWHDNARVLNNLGNVLALEGRSDEAITLYQQATAANPSDAAAYFNLSQAYTQRFDYHAATQALAHASALNFEMLRSYQSQVGADGKLPLVDEWIGPRTFWRALLRDGAPPRSRDALPPAWRRHIECSGKTFSLLVLGCVILGLLLGMFQNRGIPLRRCSNCERVVCRRCAERRREVALCRRCAAVQARAESPEFARALLLQRRRTLQQLAGRVNGALATVIPGYGLLSLRNIAAPLFLLAAAASMLVAHMNAATPYAYAPRLFLHSDFPWTLVALPWVLIYGASIASYWTEKRRIRLREAVQVKPARVRTQPFRRVDADAA